MEDNTIEEKIIQLLMLGHTRRQLIKTGFAERTVDAAIKKFKKQASTIDEEALRSNAAFLDSVIMTRYMADLTGIIRLKAPQFGITDKQLLKIRHLMAAVAEEMKNRGWKYGV